MTKTKIAVLAVMAALAAPTANSATPYRIDGGYTFKIEGFVPVICRATIDRSHVVPSEGVVQLGTMNEFCNNGSGYQVWATHSASLAGSTLVVDGREVRLSRSGETLLSHSRSAAAAQRHLVLNLADGTSSGSLSVRVRTL